MATRRYFFFRIEEGQRVPRLPIRSWGFVIVVGTVLAVISIIDRGGLATAPVAVSGGSCQFTVSTVPNTVPLNVRAEPTVTAIQVKQLEVGTAVTATNVVTGGFRKIADGQWALDQYLTPVPGTSCG